MQISADVIDSVILGEQQSNLAAAVKDEDCAGVVHGVFAVGIALAVAESYTVAPGQVAQLGRCTCQADYLWGEGVGVGGQPGRSVAVGIDADKQYPGEIGLFAHSVQDGCQLRQRGRAGLHTVAEAEKHHYYLAGVIIGVHSAAVLVRQGESQIRHEVSNHPGPPR